MNGNVRSSVGLLWRHQRLIWWIFAVNLFLAWLASLPARVTLSAVLDHSLESTRFITGFDLTALATMIQRPDVQPGALGAAAIVSAVVFFFYMLLIDGGIFAVYLDDRKLSRAEFFENSGLFFWRMFRLALYAIIPFAIAAAINGGIAKYAGKLATDAPQERLGFFVNLEGKLIFVLLALFVRLWFDLAQASIVKDNERKVLRTVWRSLKLVFHSGKLYVTYLGIGLYIALVFGVGIAIWVYLPHRATFLSFLVLELVTIKLITARMWMKAVSARWISLLPPAIAMVPFLPPSHETLATPAPAPEVEPTDLPAPPEPPVPE